MELIVARVGYRRAMRVVAFIMQWAIAEDDIGHRPTVEEYCDWWGEGAAYTTAYRDLAIFREALPWFDHPTGFLAVAGADLRQRIPAPYAGDMGLA